MSLISSASSIQSEIKNTLSDGSTSETDDTINMTCQESLYPWDISPPATPFKAVRKTIKPLFPCEEWQKRNLNGRISGIRLAKRYDQFAIELFRKDFPHQLSRIHCNAKTVENHVNNCPPCWQAVSQRENKNNELITIPLDRLNELRLVHDALKMLHAPSPKDLNTSSKNVVHCSVVQSVFKNWKDKPYKSQLIYREISERLEAIHLLPVPNNRITSHVQNCRHPDGCKELRDRLRGKNTETA